MVVLITGASSGIGEALAREYARRGFDLALCARRLDRIEALGRELGAQGRRVLPIACDVTRREDLDRAVAETRARLGRIDTVIANAGFGVAGAFEGLSAEDYRRQFETNIYGVLHTVWAALPALKESCGKLGLIGSVTSYISLPGNSAYAMSKAAVLALGDSLFHELKPSGVSVTLIHPGFVDSEIRKVDNTGALHPHAKEPIPGWLRMPSHVAARQIYCAIERRERERVVTVHGKIAVFIKRHFPSFFVWALSRSGLSARKEPAKETAQSRLPKE